MSLVKSAPCSRSASSTSSVAPDTGSSGCASPRTDWSSHGRSARITSVTGVARDADELLPRRRRRRRVVADLQPRPGHFTGHAQLVEPGAPVPGHAAWEHRLLPDAGGDLEALELRDGCGDACAPLALRARGDALPAQQEAHEVLRGDRLDLLPQALLRVAVNADEQAPRAPLIVAATPGSKWPRMTNPSPSTAASPIATSERRSPVTAESASAVTGPLTSRCPRRIAAISASRSGGLGRAARGNATGRGASVASGHSASTAAGALHGAPEHCRRRC